MIGSLLTSLLERGQGVLFFSRANQGHGCVTKDDLCSTEAKNLKLANEMLEYEDKAAEDLVKLQAAEAREEQSSAELAIKVLDGKAPLSVCSWKPRRRGVGGFELLFGQRMGHRSHPHPSWGLLFEL